MDSACQSSSVPAMQQNEMRASDRNETRVTETKREGPKQNKMNIQSVQTI